MSKIRDEMAVEYSGLKEHDRDNNLDYGYGPALEKGFKAGWDAALENPPEVLALKEQYELACQSDNAHREELESTREKLAALEAENEELKRLVRAYTS